MEKKKNKVSIIILSYNTMEITKLCLDSIRRFTEPGSYEIIVIDNASSDGSVEYLQTLPDIKLIQNNENKGFPGGCNQGISAAEKGNDILLLNSDTIVTPRWLRQLRTALYSDAKIGAVSCVTNCCSNRQQISVSYTSTAELAQFAENYNRTDEKKWIPFFRLVGFCMLIKRTVVDKIGCLDEAFSPGNYEDDDYSFRIRQAGYKLLLCQDTFIHHFGSASFTKHLSAEELKAKSERYNRLLQRNQQIFFNKWQISGTSCAIDRLITEKMPDNLRVDANILHIGCGCGTGLYWLKEKFPTANISGIAYTEAEARIAGWGFKTEFCSNIAEKVFDLLQEDYDLIIVSDLERQVQNIEGFLERLLHFVRIGGAVYFWLGNEPCAVDRD